MSSPDVDVEVDPVPVEQELRRLHPLTPIMRSWRLIAGSGAIAFGLFRDEVDRLIWLWDALHGDVELSLLVQGFLVLVAVTVVSVTGAWLSWRATGFAIVPDANGVTTLLYHRGLIVKQRRQVRLNRVQAVDVNQPLVPRLVGLAAVRLDMAAGDEASVDLAYLRQSEAWELRTEILRYTQTGIAQPAVEGEVGPVDDLIATVATAHVVKANLLDGLLAWVIAVLWFVSLGVVGVVWGPRALVAALSGIIPISIAIFAQTRRQISSILRDSNFQLFRTATGIRVSSGLTSTTNRTIDQSRIQGVRLEEPWLWRRFGWARVLVDIAGTKGDGEHAAALIPVAPRRAALALITDVTGAMFDDAPYVPAGDRAGVVDPLGSRFLGVALLEHGAIRSQGRWRRTTSYVPFARVQSVTAAQGPVQRHLGLATVYLDLPKGSERWKARHRGQDDAAGLVAALGQLAREHRLSEDHRT